jgi:SWI/SNF chromatin-remodeling complex subunit SWI1
MGDSNMAGSNRQQPPAATLKQRQRNFLNGLTSVMSARGTPLPPALTGVPNAQYDPNASPWKSLEPSLTEVGAFRLAGKDVDLFRLWGLVFQAGGHAKVCSLSTPISYTAHTRSHQLTQQNAWGQILSQFDLTEHTPVPQPNGQ